MSVPRPVNGARYVASKEALEVASVIRLGHMGGIASRASESHNDLLDEECTAQRGCGAISGEQRADDFAVDRVFVFA